MHICNNKKWKLTIDIVKQKDISNNFPPRQVFILRMGWERIQSSSSAFDIRYQVSSYHPPRCQMYFAANSFKFAFLQSLMFSLGHLHFMRCEYAGLLFVWRSLRCSVLPSNVKELGTQVLLLTSRDNQIYYKYSTIRLRYKMYEIDIQMRMSCEPPVLLLTLDTKFRVTHPLCADTLPCR